MKCKKKRRRKKKEKEKKRVSALSVPQNILFYSHLKGAMKDLNIQIRALWRATVK
jgi:predicted transposase YbfD/YdcC